MNLNKNYIDRRRIRCTIRCDSRISPEKCLLNIIKKKLNFLIKILQKVYQESHEIYVCRIFPTNKNSVTYVEDVDLYGTGFSGAKIPDNPGSLRWSHLKLTIYWIICRKYAIVSILRRQFLLKKKSNKKKAVLYFNCTVPVL